MCIRDSVVTELDVSCMPSDLPEFIAVDLGGLKKGVSLHLKDGKLPKGVSAVIKGGQNNPVLVSVANPIVEAAPVEAAAAPAAPAKGKGKRLYAGLVPLPLGDAPRSLSPGTQTARLQRAVFSGAWDAP